MPAAKPNRVALALGAGPVVVANDDHSRPVDFAAQIRGFQFATSADADIRKMAEVAADTILSDAIGRPNLAGFVKVGEQSFERLVEEMIGSAHAITGVSPLQQGTIGERTLADAMLRMCPLWPIC